MAVRHFVTNFTYVSRHFGVYCRKEEEKIVKTVLKMWSQMFKKNGLRVHNTTFRKKVQKLQQKKIIKKKQLKPLKSLANSRYKISSSGKFLRPQNFKTVFPKQFFFVFYSKLQNV